MNKGNPWTREEIAELNRLYGQVSQRHIQRVLGRSKNAVRGKIQRLGLIPEFPPKTWTEEETHELKYTYAYTNRKMLARRFKCTHEQIRNKIAHLGWSRYKAACFAIEHNLGGEEMYKRPWTKEESQELRGLYNKWTMQQLCEHFRRTDRSIFCKAQKLKLVEKHSIRWTDQRTHELKYYYATETAKQLAVRFGISQLAVHSALCKKQILKKAAREYKNEIDSAVRTFATAAVTDTELCLRTD